MRDRINHKIASMVPFLVIAIVCAGMVKGGYTIAGHYLFRPPEKRAIIEETSEQDRSQESSGSDPEKDYKIILERNLFGSLPENKVEPTRASADYTDDLELTNLDIVLLGTVQGREGDNRAIILDKSTNQQDLYEMGGVIQSALIKKIMRGKVIISFNGSDQILDMSEAAKIRGGGTPGKPLAKGALQRKTAPHLPVAVAPVRSRQTTTKSPTKRIVRPRIIRPSRKVSTQ